jgi:cysteine desulfuration protein SufE
MSIEEIENKIVDDFSMFDEWEDKYGYLVELGKKLSPLDEKYKTDERLIRGCQSRVWLRSFLDDKGEVVYEAYGESSITQGLISLLVQVLSHHTPKEIMEADLTFIDKIGMKQHLSPLRSNGLLSMVKQMKLDALAFNSIEL